MEHDVMDTTIEHEQQAKFWTLGELAEGALEARADLDQLDRLDELTERLAAGEFHKPTVGTIPCACVDDRLCEGHGELMPNGPGGSEVMMVADDLTTKNFALDGDNTTAGQQANTLKFLKQLGYPIGAHEDCGFNKRLADAYSYMVRRGDALRDLSLSLGYEIVKDDERGVDDHGLIMNNAAARTEFSDAEAVLDVTRNEGGRIDKMVGPHLAVALVITRRPGMTLDRAALEAEFGPQYKVFNVDEGSFEEAARITSTIGGEDEKRQKRLAMLYASIATGCILSGPGMRIIPLE